jgi:hypothetical protein
LRFCLLVLKRIIKKRVAKKSHPSISTTNSN